ncbi:MAG: transglutaminase family protein, partial [Oceanococcaceae bacterium]
PQVIRLRPAPHARTPVTAYSLTVEPQPHFLNWLQDPQGNWMARVVFPDKVTEFRVTVDLVARLDVFNPFDFFLDDDAQKVPFTYAEDMAEELAPFRKAGPAGPLLRRLLRGVSQNGQGTMDFLVQLNQDLQQRIAYSIRMEPGVQTPEETLALGIGSCRDTGWLLVQMLRHLGFAARFVSGYLIQLKADQEALDGPSGTDTDFTDLHAWCEVYVPGAGWVGLDPTSGMLAGEGHIPLASTPGPGSAAPITGAVDDCKVEFDHRMQIQRMHEPPRVTRPYTEGQWKRIDALGHVVDAGIAEEDIRLTMGGEPTFVAIDYPQDPEWNTDAVGPNKQRLAADLAERLRKRLAPGALITYGQGKWYPGESLPRWAYTLIWRGDRLPVVHAPQQHVLNESGERLGADQAQQLMVEITERLGIPERCIHPAYEDPWHFLAEEAALAADASLENPNFDDAERRQQLQRAFSRPLSEPRGLVLPLQCWQTRAGRSWISEVWELRRGKLFLIPGDSPVGLRMPLDSLPAVEVDPVIADDPTTVPSELPQRFTPLPVASAAERRKQREKREQREQHLPKAMPEDLALTEPVGRGVRTALSIEPKDGLLGVFMPPTRNAEEYLELVAVVEHAAETLQLPMRVEGYPPPEDARLGTLRLTPDPGVIEVNIPPAHDWDELKQIIEGLYEEARLARLGTEKFLVDGKHTGTGGGNHIVVGGATPLDSPFLRRPDMLGSVIRCWQNHPVLSYMFAGLFIGPTSQSPRIDEARDDALYEMDLALAQVPSPGAGETPPPWKVDRIFRNLLTDLAGNTHRAEICIDKMYSPDSATGRLGLVELRAFEMPPHAQMSLVQQLLVRALLVWFWREPYTRPLQRFGDRLHDEMLLPHFLWQNLSALLADLRGAGFAFDPAWFAPHRDFRCPPLGEVTVAGQRIRLRGALEPWPTMGEEPGGGSTARYVDSSLDRVEVYVDDYQPERYTLLCNGRRVPLQPAGATGAFVAGVRYRAWQPWSALHPGIPAHNPLRFELRDNAAGHSAGGCVYHVHHPAGRSYDTFPINANEAESRRLARFFAFGHSPGPLPEPPAEPESRYRSTLDLRRSPLRPSPFAC